MTYDEMRQVVEVDMRRCLHREEVLESEIRRLRQCLRNLTEAVIAGQEDALLTAQELQEMLKQV